MRGSPLIRFFVLIAALAAAAAGLLRMTSARPAAEVPPPEKPSGLPPVSYRLVLSAPAATVEVDTGRATRAEPAGTLELDPANPRVGLKIRWQNPTADHHFAKLTVEAPGEPTFTHVFDAPGDLDDVVELPLHD